MTVIRMKRNSPILLFFLSITMFTMVTMINITPICAQSKIYNFPIARQTMGGMHVEKVILTDTSTIIKAFCTNDTYKPSALISTAPPGSNNAFRLIAKQNFYQLQGVEGIPTGTENVTLPFGDSIYFDLIFKTIPNDTKVIDLVEGASQVENAWMLYGIQLCDKMVIKDGMQNMFKGAQSFENYFEKNKRRLWAMEGFWEIDAYLTTKDEKTKVPFLTKKEKVAIVREHNNFNVYTMKGEKVNLNLKHFKRDKYVVNFPVSGLYPVQRTFKYKIKFELSFKLAKRHVKTLNIEKDFGRKRVYYDSTWRFLGLKD